MLHIFKINIWRIIRQWEVNMGMLFGALAIMLSFVSWEEIGITKIKDKIFIFIAVAAVGLITAIIWISLIKKINQIWAEGTGKINVCYGNILKTAFLA